MTTATSSADPLALIRYADVAEGINALLDREAGQLEAALATFTALEIAH